MSSTSIDVQSILAALRESLENRPRERNNLAIKRNLMGKGFSEPLSRVTALNELCYWTEQEVDDVFGRLLATPDEIKDPELKSFALKLSAAEEAAGIDPTDYVKPSRVEVEHSAAVLGALCVNRKGEFRTNPPEGYAALSHVWAQGLGSDDQNRGLHRSLIEQVFDRVAPLGINWIWTDSVAIPGGGQELEFAEEELKAELINAMADIYRKARQVIVFDALALRLASTDAVDVAVILCFGRWVSRVWTYQEIKLATDAVVVTEAGFVRFADIVNTIRSNAHSEVGEGYDSTQMGRFPSLFRTYFRLQRNDMVGVTLADIAIGCGYRNAFDKLDYARSVFPTLGLEWRFGDTIEEAMRKIYEAQKYQATRLIFFHGPPRASYPGWAPAVFPGLVDSKIAAAGTWKLRGMAGEWLTSKVNKIVPSKPGCTILELDNGQSPGSYSLCYISEATKAQSPKSIEIFEEAVRKGTAYVLSDEPLVSQKPYARVGLLVEKFTEPSKPEGWVCFTLAIGETTEPYKAEKQEWLLLHENPTTDKGKQESELNYLLERSSQHAPSGYRAENRLHAAAQEGDNDTIASILNSPEYVDFAIQDSRGWTALHYAAAGGHTAAVRTLATNRACLTIPTLNGETPLVLAVDNGHLDTVCELVEAGADVNDFRPKIVSPLVTAARRGNIEMVRLLLAFEADVSLPDGWMGSTPLMSAIPGSGEARDENLAILAEFINAGADVNAFGGPGLSAIAFAVFQRNVAAARMLLAHKADPEGNRALLSPLQDAIDERDIAMVEALLEYGAQVDGPGSEKRFRDGWTPMMWAAAVGDVPIGRLLRDKSSNLLYAVGGKEKWTALHVAAVKGNRFFFKWILEESKKSKYKWDEVNFKIAWQLRTWDA